MDHSIIWVHGDNLSPTQPIWTQFPQVPAVWVWDDDLLQAWGISFKRLVFIYECLLELPVEIRRGQVIQELTDFIHQHHATQVITSPSPSPRFRQICQGLPVPIQIISSSAFVEIPDNTDLKRFSRYWKAAKPNLLS